MRIHVFTLVLLLSACKSKSTLKTQELDPNPNTTPGPSTGTNTGIGIVSNFKVGDKIELIKNTNVRSLAQISPTTLLGTQPIGAIGIIKEGPIQSKDNHGTITWYKVDFQNWIDGIAGEDNFKIYTAPTQQAPSPKPSTPQPDPQSPVNTAPIVTGSGCVNGKAKAISQFGITWYFDKEHTCGTFVNGDFWIVGPAVITKITPESVVDSVSPVYLKQGSTYVTIPWIKNGTMVNPKPSPDNAAQGQGFDNSTSNLFGWYSSALNVAPSITGKSLQAPVGSSILSSISVSKIPAKNDYKERIQIMAALTVLGSAPPAGSFRPHIVGTDKRVRWNKNQLDYSILQKLKPLASTPALSVVESRFEKPWQTAWEGNQAQGISPIGNMRSYGRDQAHQVSEALFSLNFDYSNTQKEKLYIRLVQYGLDVYGTIRAAESLNATLLAAGKDPFYRGSGGLNVGRKAPMVLAALALNDSEILQWSDGKKYPFHEDKQTFYVSQRDVNLPRYDYLHKPLKAGETGCTVYSGGKCARPIAAYTANMIGTPEWVVDTYLLWSSKAGSNWNATYRAINGASFVGNALGISLIKGGKAAWNWPAYFDYTKRHWDVEQAISGGVYNRQSDMGNPIPVFVWDMVNTYGLD